MHPGEPPGHLKRSPVARRTRLTGALLNTFAVSAWSKGRVHQGAYATPQRHSHTCTKVGRHRGAPENHSGSQLLHLLPLPGIFFDWLDAAQHEKR